MRVGRHGICDLGFHTVLHDLIEIEGRHPTISVCCHPEEFENAGMIFGTG
jgi:hypothetical protein